MRSKILLCLRYGIGDLVMELPALDALRAAWPKAHLTALGSRPAIELLEEDPCLDALLAVEDFGFSHWGDEGTAPVRDAFRTWLQAEHFDAVFDPSHAVLGIQEIIREETLPVFDAGPELQDRALQAGLSGAAAVREAILAGWGMSLQATALPRVTLRPAERDFARHFLTEGGLAGEVPIGISVVASSPLKRWPVGRLAELVEQLGVPVLLFHGPQEEAGAVLTTLRGRVRLAAVGAVHLRQVAALLADCRLFIGHDTGLMHLAAAVGVPIVALFGPTSPDIYLPSQVPAVGLGGRDGCPWRRTGSFGPPRCLVLGHCLQEGRSCIDAIETPEVLAAVRTLATGTVASACASPGE